MAEERGYTPSKQQREHATQIFKDADLDNSGTVNIEELRAALDAEGSGDDE